MEEIVLEISNPCNEHCLHCYRCNLNSKKEFLSPAQANNIFKQSIELGATRVLITGGEVLLNPEWRRIVQIADELGFHILFLSNGSLMKEADAGFLATLKNLKEVQISLYALDESVHDTITGLKGSCSKTKNAIDLLRKRNVPLFISCPVMKENKTASLDVMRWCDNNNIKSCADIFIFGDSDYTEKNLLHRLSWNELQDFFDETMKDNGMLSYIWGNGFGERDLSQIEFYSGAAHSLCVSGDGTIYPAVGWYEPLGNIDKNKLSDVFQNNSLLQKLRKIHASDITECAECICSDFCDFCLSPHITANHGELGKVDKEYCKFVALRKRFANMRDTINYLQSIIGKSIIKTEKQSIYNIEDIGEFRIETNTSDFSHSTCSSQNSNNDFSFELTESETDVVTITPVDKTKLERNSTSIIVRKTDSNSFIFYGSDGKKLSEDKIYAEIEKIYNIYNNPIKCIKK